MKTLFQILPIIYDFLLLATKLANCINKDLRVLYPRTGLFALQFLKSDLQITKDSRITAIKSRLYK